eukprot:gnl/TRDRNA2_/TRDRNA2_177636_c0_seq2.p1 gnl/TRDRNA2_/TRDRNA2_177636_c0~~gnl/TRDRNA2_/TRDRNA2_177636_c0_seq2.p1  ORF type:complete len:312 (+),score=-19.95 gnl/TRDRNA2_/TRDRNA2_177636_c0_seq2:2-937(+)
MYSNFIWQKNNVMKLKFKNTSKSMKKSIASIHYPNITFSHTNIRTLKNSKYKISEPNFMNKLLPVTTSTSASHPSHAQTTLAKIAVYMDKGAHTQKWTHSDKIKLIELIEKATNESNTYSSSEIATIVHSMATIKIRDLKILKKLTNAVAETVSSLDAYNCSLILDSFAKMRVVSKELIQKIQNRIFHPEVVIGIDTQTLLTLLRALGMIKSPITTRNKTSLIYLFDCHIPLMTLKELIDSIWALARLGITDYLIAEKVCCILNRAIKDKPETFTGYQIQNILWSLSKFSYLEKNILETIDLGFVSYNTIV